MTFVRSWMENPSNPTSNCNKFHFPSSRNFGSLGHSPNGVLYVFSRRLMNPAWVIFELIVGDRSIDCPVRSPAALKSWFKTIWSQQISNKLEKERFGCNLWWFTSANLCNGLSGGTVSSSQWTYNDGSICCMNPPGFRCLVFLSVSPYFCTLGSSQMCLT